jgi:hypothetical protein
LAFSFFVGAININMQNTNAGVFFGENQQSGWSSHRKTDNGVGQQNGIFSSTANLTFINDNDVNDGNIFDPDIISAVQGQTI